MSTRRELLLLFAPWLAFALMLIAGYSLHVRTERGILVSEVTRQIDRRVPHIGELLVDMRGSNVSLVEDAIFKELQDQSAPSTSVISRSMVRVAPRGDGRLECIIDTGSLGIPSRTIQSPQQSSPVL